MINQDTSSTVLSPSWIHSFFDTYYGEFGLTWTEEEQIQVASSLKSILNLNQGEVVFDQCCGLGGLSWGFSRLDIEAIGVDLSHSYIQKAQIEHPPTKIKSQFYCADAFTFQPPKPIDAAVNWHSSFGYAGIQGGLKMIQNLRAKLKKNQKWLLELPNLSYLKSHFQPVFKQRLKNDERLQLIRHSAWDRGWLEQDWFVMQDNEYVWKKEKTRCWCFSIPEILEMIHHFDDKLVGMYGNLSMEPLHHQHERMIIVVEKQGF